MKLEGAQRLILQALMDFQAEGSQTVSDTRISQNLQIDLIQVRDWLIILENSEYVSLTRTTEGFLVQVEAKGRLALEHHRLFPKIQETGTAGSASDRSGHIIDSSGNWVLLDEHFFEAKAVRQAGKNLSVVIASQASVIDARMQALRPNHQRANRAIAFAHRNDAQFVVVEEVESESTADGMDWIIKLKSGTNEQGGIGLEAAAQIGGKQYSADEIAELRARRILLNDPPPLEIKHRGYSDRSFLEGFIRGTNVRQPADRCIIRQVFAQFGNDPPLALRLARLAAILALKASDTVEHVETLILGPIERDRVRVVFGGLRRKVYENRSPHSIEFEGHCPLT